MRQFHLHRFWLSTSSPNKGAKYCDKSVCLSVYLSVVYLLN